METDAVELYRRYRPHTLKEVVGQSVAVRTLADLGKRQAIPHALLFSGPSGCGKTTLARIVADKLGCHGTDFAEVDMARYRGIDSIREISEKIWLAPMHSKCRAWLLDECHQITGQASDALLKMLEDTPPTVYFFLCTTDPAKLKPTICTRCTEIKLELISTDAMESLVRRVAEAEGSSLDESVVDKIVDVAEGSARKALVILHAAIGHRTVESQLESVAKSDFKSQGVELARLLVPGKNKSLGTWKEIAKVLDAMEDEVEPVLQVVLSFARSALLKGWADPEHAYFVLEVFKRPFYECGTGNAPAAALVSASYEVFSRSGS